MKASVWVIAKPDEDRICPQAFAPSQERAAALRKQGYRIIRVEFDMPPEFDTSTHEVAGRVDRRST